MAPIGGPVAETLIAEKANVQAKIDVAVARQQLDVTRESGAAVNSLLEQVIVAQKQISQGRLDVRV